MGQLANSVRIAYVLDAGKVDDPELIAVPGWRVAKWLRCIAAARMCLPPEDPADPGRPANEAILQCMRALTWLHVPMPWSAEFKRYIRGFRGMRVFVVHYLDRIAARPYAKAQKRAAKAAAAKAAAAKAAAAGEAEGEDPIDGPPPAELASLAQLGAIPTQRFPENTPTSAASVRSLYANFLPAAASEREEAAAEGLAVMRVLTDAMVQATDVDKAGIKYALWVCAFLEGKRVGPDSPFHGLHVRLHAALGAKPRPKGSNAEKQAAMRVLHELVHPVHMLAKLSLPSDDHGDKAHRDREEEELAA